MAIEFIIGKYHHITEGRKRARPITFNKAFKEATQLKELDANLVVTGNRICFTQEIDQNTLETYEEKQIRERAKGENEAVSYGYGSIGKNKFVEVVFNFEYMRGSAGVVAETKIRRAMKLAIKEDLPVVILYSSAGARQQEASPALRSMLGITDSINQFKEETKLPVISVLVGDVWGGLQASGIPMGEPVIGIAGTNGGFAGKSASGKEPPGGALTVENANLTNKQVQVILNDVQELGDYLEKYLSIFSGQVKSAEHRRTHETTGVEFGEKGFYTPFKPIRSLISHRRADMSVPVRLNNGSGIYEQYRVLCLDSRRPDTLYLLMHAFDGFVPFFSSWITERTTDRGTERHLRYPGIIAALAYIDDSKLQQRLVRLVVGNQPSYLKQTNGTIKREHAEPTSWDYRYELNMFDYGKRFGLQITTIGDTFGASAELEDDLSAQYSAISQCLQAQLRYPYFTGGYNIQIGGSGGWLGTTCTADYIAMLEGAQEYVATPVSAAGIIYKSSEVPNRLVRLTAEGMKPSAKFLFEHGLIDRIIPEPEGGAQNNPLATALAIRNDIILNEIAFGKLKTQDILKRRRERMENGIQNILADGTVSKKAIEIGYLDEESQQPRRSILRTTFNRISSVLKFPH